VNLDLTRSREGREQAACKNDKQNQKLQKYLLTIPKRGMYDEYFN
jgi:hypothetical protein